MRLELQGVGELCPTAWAFEQLAQRVGAPPRYLRRLPVPLIVRLLNHGIGTRRESRAAPLLLFRPEEVESDGDEAGARAVLRAVTGPGYARLWDAQIASHLEGLEAMGWRVPPARPLFADQPGARLATEADVLWSDEFELSVRVGDPIAPAGLCLGDRSLFAFLIREERRIEDGTEGGLSRDVFVWNREVGCCSFGPSSFLFRHVCGNHIVWGVSGLEETRLRHVGSADRRAALLLERLFGYAESSARVEEARIRSARSYALGRDREEVLRRVAAMELPALTRARARVAWEWAEEYAEVDGPPATAWGFAQGVTRFSRPFRMPTPGPPSTGAPGGSCSWRDEGGVDPPGRAGDRHRQAAQPPVTAGQRPSGMSAEADDPPEGVDAGRSVCARMA